MEYFSCGNSFFELPKALADYTNALYILIKIILPVALIFFGIFDMIKAMMLSDSEKIAKANHLFFKRVVSGILILLVVSLVSFVVDVVDNDTNIIDCVNCLVNGVEKGNCSTYVKDGK